MFFQVERRNVDSHLQLAVRLHLDLACVKLNNTQGELKRSQETTSQLSKKVDVLENRLKLIEEKVNIEQSHLRVQINNVRSRDARVIDDNLKKIEHEVKILQTQLIKATELEERVTKMEERYKNENQLPRTLRPMAQGGLNQTLLQEQQKKASFIGQNELFKKGIIFDELNSWAKVWEIRGVTDIFRQAACAGPLRGQIESPSFYLGDLKAFGYKCKLCLNPNCVSLNGINIVSLYFKVIKGEYDASLPWPFRKMVTLMIIDQQSNALKNITKSFSTDLVRAWQFSDSVSVHEGGFNWFATLTQLSGRGYLIKDTLIIKVMAKPD